MQETWVQSLVGKIPWRRERLPTPVFWPGECHNCGLPYSSDGKEFACNEGDGSLIPGSGRSPGEGNGNPLQYSWLENPMDRGLAGYSPWGQKELDTTKWLTHTYIPMGPHWPSYFFWFSFYHVMPQTGNSTCPSARAWNQPSLLCQPIWEDLQVIFISAVHSGRSLGCNWNKRGMLLLHYISDSLKEEADRWRRNK